MKRGCNVLIFVLILLVLFNLNFSLVSAIIPDDCHSSMVSYWKFDDNADDSFDGNDGAENGGLTFDASGGKVLKYISFDVSDGSQYANISDDSSLESDEGTIEMWISVSLGGIYEDFLFNKQGSYSLRFQGSGGSSAPLQFNISSNILTSDESIIEDKWYFIVLKWDATSSDLYIYNESGKVDSVSGGGVAPDSLKSSSALFIGIEKVGASYNYNGLIDEFAFYDSSLSDADINSHFSLSNSGANYCHVPGDAASSTKTNFNIDGCDSPELDEPLAVGACSESGAYYCASKDVLYDTSVQGCDLGGGRTCCPKGYKCDSSSGTDKCVQRLKDCRDYVDEGECDENSCAWIGGKCYDPDDPALSCSIYKSDSTCTEDKWNLGLNGAGTEVCGTSTDSGIIRSSSCMCAWDSSDSQCYLSYEILEEIHSTEDGDGFTCKKNFTSSDCVSGKMDIFWNAYSDPVVSAGGFPKQSDLDNTGCVDGSLTRECGTKIIKMPGFSFINVVLVLLGLGVFYLLKSREFVFKN